MKENPLPAIPIPYCRLAAGSLDGTVLLWYLNAQTLSTHLTPLRVIMTGHQQHIISLTWSPASSGPPGRWLLAGVTSDSTLHVSAASYLLYLLHFHGICATDL